MSSTKMTKWFPPSSNRISIFSVIFVRVRSHKLECRELLQWIEARFVFNSLHEIQCCWVRSSLYKGGAQTICLLQSRTIRIFCVQTFDVIRTMLKYLLLQMKLVKTLFFCWGYRYNLFQNSVANTCFFVSWSIISYSLSLSAQEKLM